MNKNNVNVVSGGTSVTTLLQVAFIVLKLCNVIDWSWWLVLLPGIISVGFLLLYLIFILIFILCFNRGN